MMMMMMTHLFEVTEEQITVLVEESVDIIGDRPGVVYQTELLTYNHKRHPPSFLVEGFHQFYV